MKHNGKELATMTADELQEVISYFEVGLYSMTAEMLATEASAILRQRRLVVKRVYGLPDQRKG